MLRGRILTSEHCWTSVVMGQNRVARYAQRPVTYGLTVLYGF